MLALTCPGIMLFSLSTPWYLATFMTSLPRIFANFSPYVVRLFTRLGMPLRQGSMFLNVSRNSLICSMIWSSVWPLSALSNKPSKKSCTNSGVSDRLISMPMILSLPPSGWYPSISRHLIAYRFLVINTPERPTTSRPAFITLPACKGTLNSFFKNPGNVSDTSSEILS